jgi:hypothetical protein
VHTADDELLPVLVKRLWMSKYMKLQHLTIVDIIKQWLGMLHRRLWQNQNSICNCGGLLEKQTEREEEREREGYWL